MYLYVHMFIISYSMYCSQGVPDLIPYEDKLKLIFNILYIAGGRFDPL